MKKVITIAAIFIILIGAWANAAMAESTASIDFSVYSLEELLQIKKDLVEEISCRPGGEKTVLGIGQYSIGGDLPSGVYTFRHVQNGDADVERTDYYIYENESMYKYDVDRCWLGDMPRLEGSLKGDGETRISLYSGEYLCLYHNGAEIERIGDVAERSIEYEVPSGTTIPKGNYTIGNEIPAGSYNIYFSGTATSRVRVFQDAKEADGTFNKGAETILDAVNPEGAVTLADGNILRVEYTPIIMTKSSGFTFD